MHTFSLLRQQAHACTGFSWHLLRTRAHPWSRRAQVKDRLAGKAMRPEQELHYTSAELLADFDLDTARDYARAHAGALSAAVRQVRKQAAELILPY